MNPIEYCPPGFFWICSSGGCDVPGAICVSSAGSEDMYVGRAFHNNDLVPGKVHRSHNSLYLAWGKS